MSDFSAIFIRSTYSTLVDLTRNTAKCHSEPSFERNSISLVITKRGNNYWIVNCVRRTFLNGIWLYIIRKISLLDIHGPLWLILIEKWTNGSWLFFQLWEKNFDPNWFSGWKKCRPGFDWRLLSSSRLIPKVEYYNWKRVRLMNFF